MGQYVKIIIAASVHLVRSPLQNFVPRALAIFPLPYPGVRPNAAREGARTETGCRDAQDPREPGGVDEFTQQMEAWQRGPEVGERGSALDQSSVAGLDVDARQGIMTGQTSRKFRRGRPAYVDPGYA